MNPDEMFKLAEKVYEGLSKEDIAEMEKVMLDRSNFSGERTKRLEELLEGVNEDNLHGETDWGKPVGKEIIE
ncbi:MAG TPA: hypothetical protein VGB68_15715 [Pyrinomonadaceae bacterium]